MAEFKYFTLGFGITVVVLGAAAGSAIGLASGGLPSPTPAKTAMSQTTDPATPAATHSAGTGRPATSTAAPMGKDTTNTVGKTSMGQPGVLHLGGMPTGAVRVWRNPQGKLMAKLAVYS